MKQDEGFTLLEVTCSLVVLGFILVALSYSIKFGLMAWELQGKASSDVGSSESVHRVLRLVLQQALPPRSLGDKPFVGQEHRLVIITEMPKRFDVRSAWRARVAIGVDSDHRLLLRWERFAVSSNEPEETATAEEILANGIDTIEIYYRRPRSEGGAWLRTWNESLLPAAVRVEFGMQDQRRRLPFLQVSILLARHD